VFQSRCQYWHIHSYFIACAFFARWFFGNPIIGEVLVIMNKICNLLTQGHTIATVCGALRIAERTYFDWCEKHLHFSQASTRAIEQSKIVLVEKLRGAADWRAQAFLLERSFPAEFGRVAERPLPEVEKASEEKQVSITVVLNTGGKSLEEITAFPSPRLRNHREKRCPKLNRSVASLFDPNPDDLGTLPC
jgi:hypothetical protein